jgi:hypothetical protein
MKSERELWLEKRVEELERQAHAKGPMIAAGWKLLEKRAEAAEAENARLREERAIIDRELRKSNLDATRWFIIQALAQPEEQCPHGNPPNYPYCCRPLPQSQPARAIEICKRAAQPDEVK